MNDQQKQPTPGTVAGGQGGKAGQTERTAAPRATGMSAGQGANGMSAGQGAGERSESQNGTSKPRRRRNRKGRGRGRGAGAQQTQGSQQNPAPQSAALTDARPSQAPGTANQAPSQAPGEAVSQAPSEGRRRRRSNRNQNNRNQNNRNQSNQKRTTANKAQKANKPHKPVKPTNPNKPNHETSLKTSDEISAGGLVISGLAEAVQADNTVDLGRIYVALIGRLDRRGRLLWSMPKGHVEPGEDRAATAAREVWEETGIHGEVLAELGVIDYWFVSEGTRIHKTVHHHLLAYVDGDLNDEDPEVTEVAWIPASQLLERLAYADERKLARIAHDLLPEFALQAKAAGRLTPR